ncbi:MAG: tRNA (guanosine(46)-N7)-methyltransferase TrmB [Bacteroidales bacterium]|nr:tRNA (guanosine(46)-N7)-methyltransferase TrmB [Bacteroidales bacterium]
MGHGKLKKFAENETFRCLLQPDASSVLDKEAGSRELRLRDHAIKGRWGAEMFGNDHPIVLELGCGGGDYTIALALRHPENNYIGVDIKGARLWKGAKYATENALPNVAFLRTRIEFIEAFFGPGEVSEIWLTFSDPQLRGSENARLSSPLFLERYRKFLKPGGVIHLKTDSRYLFEYTSAVCKVNGLRVLASSTDIYLEGTHGVDLVQHSFGRGSFLGGGPGPAHLAPRPLGSTIGGPGPALESGPGPNMGIIPADVTQVQTFYEKMFLQMGLPITYLAFCIDHEGAYAYPGDAFDHDFWLQAEGPRRSFSHQPTARSK